jgi:hypothetical protein
MSYCEDYPCCGHTPADPCARQWYDEPYAFDTSVNPHALCDHESGDCDVEPCCDSCGAYDECDCGDEPDDYDYANDGGEDAHLDSYMEDFMSSGAFGD